MSRYQLFIDGELCDAEGGATMAVCNPANGETVAEAPQASRTDTVRAVSAARKAFDSGPWPKLPQKERQAKLLKLVEATANGLHVGRCHSFAMSRGKR